jgi:UBX domain-containing protein 1
VCSLQARETLESFSWDFEDAVGHWFTTHNVYDDDDLTDEDISMDDPQPIRSTTNLSTGQPTSSFRTLFDLGGSAEDEDHDDEKDQDYFAGGEKSGLAVQGPGSGSNAQDHIQGILDRARR